MRTEHTTIHTCRGCDASVVGPATPTGPFDVGWALLRHIDGPNAVCPTCAADPEKLLSSLYDADGHIHAALDVLVMPLPNAGHIVLRRFAAAADGYTEEAYCHVDGSADLELWSDENICECPEDITWSRMIEALFTYAFNVGRTSGV